MSNLNDTVSLTLTMSREEMQNVQRALIALLIGYEAAPNDAKHGRYPDLLGLPSLPGAIVI